MDAIKIHILKCCSNCVSCEIILYERKLINILFSFLFTLLFRRLLFRHTRKHAQIHNIVTKSHFVCKHDWNYWSYNWPSTANLSTFRYLFNNAHVIEVICIFFRDLHIVICFSSRRIRFRFHFCYCCCY